MGVFVNYSQILTDAQAAVEAANLGFQAVLLNANDRDFVEGNYPLLDLRIRRVLPEPTAGRVNWVQIVMEAEIAAFHLTSLDKAAILRDGLVSAVQRFFQQNPRFSSGIDTVTIGQGEFFTGENVTDQGWSAASAVIELNLFLYVDG